eukprot:TRINITY_DN3827_c0_g1_i5.p3 TRINITY_DN3827_c0_g1~~TRINITY_DN3827_c0_g1_i5.p3  ORF type:complete len:174 (-),score=20.52 TRINITY_DN3827_c0_g1_i5:156-677(-)
MQNIVDVQTQLLEVQTQTKKPKHKKKSRKRRVKQDEFTQTENESVKFDRYEQYDTPMYMYQKNKTRSADTQQTMALQTDDLAIKQYIEQYNLNKAGSSSNQTECQSTQGEKYSAPSQSKCSENDDTSGESDIEEWVLVQQCEQTDASPSQTSDPKIIQFCSEDEDFQMINVQE